MFSLDDIEHGVLRGGCYSKGLAREDDKVEFIVVVTHGPKSVAALIKEVYIIIYNVWSFVILELAVT